MKRKLPNFLIIGAAKCGTSSLHHYLNQHPDLFMPTYNKDGMKVKEPRFLIKELVQSRLSKGIWDWNEYKALFEDVNNEKAIGESTVLYLYFYDYAIKNIKKYLGTNIKIIIILRNPVERAYSAYLFASRTLQENKSFKYAIDIAKDRYEKDKSLSPMILYKELGMYAEMVRAYKKSFANVHIIIYDDFITETPLEVGKVFNFLNLKDVKVKTNNIINSSGRKWDSLAVKNILMGNNFIKNIFKSLLPIRIRTLFKQYMISIFTSKADEMNKNVSNELYDFYYEDVCKLEKIIDRDLTRWKK